MPVLESDRGLRRAQSYLILAWESDKALGGPGISHAFQGMYLKEMGTVPLLKREDEKAVTERAYDNPVFVEDLVRNVALKLNAHPDVTWYKVEAENEESIHNHNAYACIEKH